MTKTVTILLVDDDLDDIDIFKDVIHSEVDSKINVIASRNGLECLEMLEYITPDIIFLDINMPIMGGKECFENLQSSKAFKLIPVVIYSTTKNEKEAAYFKERGASFLLKPVSFNDFIKPLKLVLSERLQIS